jgi:mannose-6-phosphate isomerase
MVQRLTTRVVEKPWGRYGMAPQFDVDAKRKVGEIWFEAPSGRPLDVLAKYLFTSERLSIQVHPDEATAHARGLAHGKDECWIILDVAPGAELGIGTIKPIERDALIDAAANGSIERLIDWRPARRGQFIYNPAGTVHALGPGLTVMEVQQATDITYRLFDYGRPRQLHLEESRAVVNARPHHHPADATIDADASRILVDGRYFGVAWCAGEALALPPGAHDVQLLPIDADVAIGERIARPGECWLLDDATDLSSAGSFALAWTSGG